MSSLHVFPFPSISISSGHAWLLLKSAVQGFNPRWRISASGMAEKMGKKTKRLNPHVSHRFGGFKRCFWKKSTLKIGGTWFWLDLVFNWLVLSDEQMSNWLRGDHWPVEFSGGAIFLVRKKISPPFWQLPPYIKMGFMRGESSNFSDQKVQICEWLQVT